MGSLKNVNASPRFTRYLVASQAFAMRPLVVVDVGARGGTENHWKVYGDQVRVIGFEADADECARLNRGSAGPACRFFPGALHRDRATRTFYVTAYPGSSGFYPVDERYVTEFGQEETLTIVKTVQMDTVDFDSLAHENGIDCVDFMKLDAEGAELDCLKGAGRTLRQSVLGLSVEVAFYPLHRDQPMFSDMDSFLTPQGFRLFDLSLSRYRRKDLPAIAPGRNTSPGAVGQVIWGQALYLRDGAGEIGNAAGAETDWDDHRILKLTSLMELFCQADCAIQLVRVARDRGFLRGLDTPHLLDLLVPPVGNEVLSYGDYLERVEAARNDQRSQHVPRARRLARSILPSPARRVAYKGLVAIRDWINKTIQ